MFFKNIELINFRSYENQKIDFHEKVNIITGNNAQGKTNLLEALYIMCLSKSFRTNKDNDMIRFGEDGAYIKSVVSKKDRDFEIEIIIEKNMKTVKINKQKITKKEDFFSKINIVVFSPEDLKIVKEEPEKRRRFINREICQIKPIYYNNLLRYKKILIQRNNLLKEEKVDLKVLSVWDHELSLYGSKIIMERNKFINKLNHISKKIHHDITSGKEDLQIEYESDILLKEDLEKQKTEFDQELEKNQKTDMIRGSTSKGPHRDDMKISINGIDIRHFGSQGQQRTAALSLKLAEIELIKEEMEDEPILLLDDVLSELDQPRQRFLIQSLKQVQLFLTTTEISEYIKKNLSDNRIFWIQKNKDKENTSYVKLT